MAVRYPRDLIYKELNILSAEQIYFVSIAIFCTFNRSSIEITNNHYQRELVVYKKLYLLNVAKQHF